MDPRIDLFRGWPNRDLIPDLEIRAAAEAAMSREWRYDHYHTSGFVYDESCLGHEVLRRQLSQLLVSFYMQQTSPISPHRLCITGGASQSLACILQVYSDPLFTSVWMIAPTRDPARRVFEDHGFGNKMNAIKEDDEGCDIEHLRMQLAKPSEEHHNTVSLKVNRSDRKIYRHIIHTVPTFSVFSTKTMSLARRQSLIRLAREFDALIIADDMHDMLQWSVNAEHDVYGPIDHAIIPRIADLDKRLHGGVAREGADGFGNAMSNGSFSTIIAPGMRCGWAEGTEKFIQGLSQCGSMRSGTAPSQLTAAIISRLLQDGALKSHIHLTLLPRLSRRFHTMIKAIGEYLLPLGIVVLETGHEGVVGGYFIWIKLPTPLLARNIAVEALSQKDLILAAEDSLATHEDKPAVDLSRNVRLSFSLEKQDQLIEGIKRLACVIYDAQSSKQDSKALDSCP